MKPALRDLQAAFADHVLGAGRDDVAAAVTGDSIPASARLNVYRHHVIHSLGSALATTFPTVRTLVGEAFFRRLARDYVVAEPPAQPVLSEYGAGFAGFVAAYAPAAELAYLADVARLDWALNAAFNAAFEPRLTAADLASISSERLVAMTLRLAAGTTLLRSTHAIDRIWQACQPDAEVGTVDAAGPARLLIQRRHDDAGFAAIGEGEALFVEALARGDALEKATETAIAGDSAFELTQAFARLLAFEVFAALQH